MVKTRSKIVELLKDGQQDKEAVTVTMERITKKSIGNTMHKQGWSCLMPEVVIGEKATLAKIRLYKKQKRERENSDDVFNTQLTEIIQKLHHLTKINGWKFKDAAVAATVKEEPKQNFDFQLPAEVKPYFQNIYDRDAQIRIIHSAISSAKFTLFEQRSHCLLFGQPSCGKTETLLAFEKMVGPSNVIKLSAPEMTKAGVENLILELDPVPPIIIIEELEKCNPLNLPFLLSVLDQRGEIIKTNARIGRIRKEAKSLCLATANDLGALKGMFSGALASRFAHHIYFPKPSRKVLEKIMSREISRFNGNPAWISPILDYMLDVEGSHDPRRACSLLDGKDKWLTGEYRNDLMAIRDCMKEDGIE